MERARFVEARRILAKWLTPTRIVEASSLQRSPVQNVFLKLESEQPTHSFKVRGGLYALHEKLSRGAVEEVVASSTGNHGAAVAYAAQVLGVRARIFVPEKCNPVKLANIRRFGAVIEERGALDLAGAFLAAQAYANETGAFFLNDATDENLPYGPGTIALEVLAQLPEVDSIFVPMGDTALVRGVAAAAKQISPAVKIIGVQAENAPSYYLSWKEGRTIETETCDTIADGLATRTPEARNVEAIRRLVDEVVLVSEDEMLGAIARLLMDEHVLAEPAGAAATAAFLKMSAATPGNAVLLVTGANVAKPVLRAALGGEDGDSSRPQVTMGGALS
jgi:threonine dehydratase